MTLQVICKMKVKTELHHFIEIGEKELLGMLKVKGEFVDISRGWLNDKREKMIRIKIIK